MIRRSLPLLFLAVSTAPSLAQCSAGTWKQKCSPCKQAAGCAVLASTAVADPAACCALCDADVRCLHWTFNAEQISKGTPCHLKSGPQGAFTSGNCTSSPPMPAPGPDPSKHNILFLMSDSMDGRVLDPTSPVSARLEMPNLRALATSGANFLRTYAASPQCVPSRTTMFTGRHTHSIKAWSNSQGVAGIPGKDWSTAAGLEPICIQSYSLEVCTAMAKAGNVTATILDAMRDHAYEPHLYGKVDVGAGILSDWDEGNATCDGYHGGPILPISARAADIRKATKGQPVANEEDNHVHPEDWKMVPRCIEFLHNIAARNAEAKVTSTSPHYPKQFATEPSKFENWMLYCSINIPHPAFQTNATYDDELPASPCLVLPVPLFCYRTLRLTTPPFSRIPALTRVQLACVRARRARRGAASTTRGRHASLRHIYVIIQVDTRHLYGRRYRADSPHVLRHVR